jgi:hypothetical protein
MPVQHPIALRANFMISKQPGKQTQASFLLKKYFNPENKAVFRFSFISCHVIMY